MKWIGQEVHLGDLIMSEKNLKKYFENWNPETDAIVVGTSPSLTWYPLGQCIDRFKTVIRVNKCFQDGMEKYTGHNIDIWATTGNHRWNWWTPLEENLITYENKQVSTIREIWTRVTKFASFFEKEPAKSQEKFWNGSYVSMSRENKRTLLSGNKTLRIEFGNKVPTGLLTLDTALHFYDRITIIGHTFFLESQDTDGKWAHYDFYSDNKETEQHRENGKHLGKEWFEKCLEWVQQKIEEEKIVLLNPYEYDNLRVKIK
jgi:hypothetical protein